jgi:hypothetical protein
VNLPAPPRLRAVPPPLPAPAAQQPLLNWKPVAFAGLVAVLLVAGVLAWAVQNPPDRRGPAIPAEEVRPTVAEVRDVEPAPAEPAEPVEPIMAVVVQGLPQTPGQQPVPAPVETRAPARVEPPVPAPAPLHLAAPACERFGTSVEFDPNPTRAAKRAAETQRLLVVLHISGNFEVSGFT